jgi:hypothetical protein
MARTKKTGPTGGKKKPKEFFIKESLVIFNNGWFQDSLKYRRETFSVFSSKSKCCPFLMCKRSLNRPIKVTLKANNKDYYVSRIIRTTEEPQKRKLLRQHPDCGCGRPGFHHFLRWGERDTRARTYSVHTTYKKGWKAKGPYYRITLTLASS